ncbi:C2H2 type zinc finger domain protein [Aspergillus avenaceus]|uniref:C2H2 type zinc finger domain protein n=1 Tax=Aspergillus avenaceus TaxID=36643 RepID=A0A5N6TKE5_ASPAV|nr:C2H2 type zinc finger domain protein [Aspergillus avenaceus]
MSAEDSDAGQVANLHKTEEENWSENKDHDHETQAVSTISSQTKCSICHSIFRRPEHLKRHFRSHTKEKPFECTQCGRHFSRTDTLHRHELSHHTLGPEGGKDRTHRITVKTFRACFKCAVARVRCSGGTPCVRCETRSLECQYPTERRSKAKARKDASQNQDTVNSTTHGQTLRHTLSPSADNPDVRLVHAEEQDLSPIPAYQLGQFQVQLSDTNASRTASDTRGRIKERPKNHLDNRQASEINNMILSDGNRMTDGTRNPFDSYTNMSIQQLYPQIPTSDIRATIPNGQENQFNPQFNSEIPGSNMGIDMTAAHHQLQLGFTPPFLDQSMASTLNWLSNDVLLDTTDERAVGNRLSSQSLQDGAIDNSLGQTTRLPPVISAEQQVRPSLRRSVYQSPSGNTSLGTDIETPSHTSRDVTRSSPQLGLSNDFHQMGNSYIDGGGARFPSYRRKHDLQSKPATFAGAQTQSQQVNSETSFSFPATQDMLSDETMNWQLEPTTYDRIYAAFLQLCCTDNFLYSKFETRNFPTAETLSHLIHMYFSSFQAVYPVLHAPTFDPNTCPWLLTLALSAIGCHAMGNGGRDGCAAAFHEFLRRAICVEKEKRYSTDTPLWLLQAMMLNCVGLLHGNDERARCSALNSFSELVNITTQERLLCATAKRKFGVQQKSPGAEWTTWIVDETRVRTGYFVWLLDCMLAYHFENRPLLSLDDGQAPMPSDERLWQASSADSWRQFYDKPTRQGDVSLYDAVLTLYIEKKLVPNIGEFGHILLIHALYHRMWEVGDYFHRPLSFWNPTAKKQSREAAIPTGSVWLPGIPSYSRWRNSACDCLDILHWAANSMIAKAAGLEHPTVLHLHEARIILLAPIREIRTLVTSLESGKVRWDERQKAIEWHYILRWMRHDQYKARLAIIHAGASLWYVRRYSTDAFHEPVAIFLAIITLWAYGLCHSDVFPQAEHQDGSNHKPPNDPAFFHIDRPCDDELVQLFVREGHAMKGNVTGVGDICAPEGPERILQVACDTFAGLVSWEISKRYTATLNNILQLMLRDKQQ